jgi:hypothetical protein
MQRWQAYASQIDDLAEHWRSAPGAHPQGISPGWGDQSALTARPILLIRASYGRWTRPESVNFAVRAWLRGAPMSDLGAESAIVISSLRIFPAREASTTRRNS